MHDNPKFKPYREGAIRELPEGTVARGSLALNPAAPKPGSGQAPTAQPATGTAGATTGAAGAQSISTSNPAGADQTAAATSAGGATGQTVPTGEDGFPFKVTKEILDRGQSRYNISCLPCHGKLGDGNGMIVQRGFRRPPKYTDDRLVKAPSSYFYDVVTNGFGAMSSYADQLTPEDRWKVIAYIRVLQLSQRANINELAENAKQEIQREIEKVERKNGEKQGGHPGSQPTPSSGGHSN
jgi:mono/diheme cytochrome c family protein